MPKFTVVITERIRNSRWKVFEAETPEEARQLAEEDESWTDLDGWTDDLDEGYIDTHIEGVEPCSE